MAEVQLRRNRLLVSGVDVTATLAVLTSGDRPYLAATIAAVAAQQWSGRKILCSDGPLPRAARIYGNGWEHLPVEKTHKDNAAAFRRLLNEVDGDLVFLEDDVALGGNALQFMALYPIPPELAFMSWFEAIVRHEARPQVMRVPAESFCYSQAVTIPGRTLAQLRNASWNLDGGIDSNIATILRGQFFGLHVPALVQHMGRISVAHPDRAEVPRSQTFHGEGYNVMDLFPAARGP
jgi:hypothetical protein